jgi:benzodiazapine receptor
MSRLGVACDRRLRPGRHASGADHNTPPADASDATTPPITEKPRGPLSLILPAVFSVTTLSAVRVWNAPARPERTTAMGLWAAAQALNAVWIAMRPASRGLQIAAAMSSAGLAAAFAHEARKLDNRAGKLAAPSGGGVHLANLVQGKSAIRAARFTDPRLAG